MPRSEINNHAPDANEAALIARRQYGEETASATDGSKGSPIIDPSFVDVSSGMAGFHVLAIFDGPKETRSVNSLAERIAEDHQSLGLDTRPEIFPGKPRWEHYGDWLRLFGRHHSRDHYTRVWNDEPFADEPRILASRPSPGPPEIEPAKRTLCLDFDGVIHSYTSGWCGAEIIPDPPIHGTASAIERLRKSFRVAVHSPRCRTLEGRTAIENWLKQHGIVVDEVVEHKPPAFAYVDDRAIPFTGRVGKRNSRHSRFPAVKCN
jgi:hypothetical protein